MAGRVAPFRLPELDRLERALDLFSVGLGGAQWVDTGVRVLGVGDLGGVIRQLDYIVFPDDLMAFWDGAGLVLRCDSFPGLVLGVGNIIQLACCLVGSLFSQFSVRRLVFYRPLTRP